MEFIHLADVHLGYEQYRNKQRAIDFADAFEHAAKYAIDKKVGFLLICGDFFNKKDISAETLSQACSILRKLKLKNIHVIAIEGNHDRSQYPFYGNKSFTEYLNDEEYLILLKPSFSKSGKMSFKPWDSKSRKGGYFDVGDVRIYGISYLGMNTEIYIKDIVKQIRPLKFTILMMHAGIEGRVYGMPGIIPYNALKSLKNKINYLALGHGHSRYEMDDFVFNPGALETWNSIEWDKEKGFYHVKIKNHEKVVSHIDSDRRPFFKWNISVDGISSPEHVMETVTDFLNSKLNDIKTKRNPVIELLLTGKIKFESYAINIEGIEADLHNKFNCLIGRVSNTVSSPGHESYVAPEHINRSEIEAGAIQSMIERDSRLSAMDGLPEFTVKIKNMIIQGYSSDDVIEEVHAWRQKHDD